MLIIEALCRFVFNSSWSEWGFGLLELLWWWIGVVLSFLEHLWRQSADWKSFEKTSNNLDKCLKAYAKQTRHILFPPIHLLVRVGYNFLKTARFVWKEDFVTKTHFRALLGKFWYFFNILGRYWGQVGEVSGKKIGTSFERKKTINNFIKHTHPIKDCRTAFFV